MPVLTGTSDFEQLTRRHAVKLVPTSGCSVEEATLAVGKEVGYAHIKSASRMNGAVVMFLSSTDKVAEAVTKGAVIQNSYTPVHPLVSPAKRVTISNAPPFIKNDTLLQELSRFGQIVSPVKMISLGCKSPLLKHVICHRRQVLMVLKDTDSDLNVSLSFKIEGFTYMVYATTETMKCFGCGAEGHLIRTCPERVDNTTPPARNYAQPAPEASPGPSAPPAAGTDPAPTENPTATTTTVSEPLPGREADPVGGAPPGRAADPSGEAAEPVSSGPEARAGEEGLQSTSTSVESNEKPRLTPPTVADPPTPLPPSPASAPPARPGSSADSAPCAAVDEEQGQSDRDDSDYDDMSEGESLDLSQRSMFYTSQSRKRKNKSPLKKICHQYSVTQCTPTGIKKFLADTKGTRNVKVSNFFPNLKQFAEVARPLTRVAEQNVLTEQEVFRLKKLLSKVRTEANTD